MRGWMMAVVMLAAGCAGESATGSSSSGSTGGTGSTGGLPGNTVTGELGFTVRSTTTYGFQHLPDGGLPRLSFQLSESGASPSCPGVDGGSYSRVLGVTVTPPNGSVGEGYVYEKPAASCVLSGSAFGCNLGNVATACAIRINALGDSASGTITARFDPGCDGGAVDLGGTFDLREVCSP